jgi:hypothetical protein
LPILARPARAYCSVCRGKLYEQAFECLYIAIVGLRIVLPTVGEDCDEQWSIFCQAVHVLNELVLEIRAAQIALIIKFNEPN